MSLFRSAAVWVAIAAGCDGGSVSGADAGDDATVADAGIDAPLEWPNEKSSANSDPWLVEHHDEIRLMRPRVLALNFVNGRTNHDMAEALEDIFAGIREGSRYHGYDDADAPVFLEPEIAYAIDLTDQKPPRGWPYNNSTLYPREDPVEGVWGFDYERLFSDEFAGYYGFDLCDAINQGLVHEVWVYGDADVPDVGAAEVLERKVRYDTDGNPFAGQLEPCAGNGCFDDEDEFPETCHRSIRIGWVNNTRGPGCFLESLGHGFEWTGNSATIPYLQQYFVPFGDFDLDVRYALSFDSWYACGAAKGDCLTWTDETTVSWDVGFAAGTLEEYVPRCGNAHFAPNSRNHYDDQSPYTVLSTCRHFGMRDGPDGKDGQAGDDLAEPFSTDDFTMYNDLAPDCSGGWKIWWRQNYPGLDNLALDDDGKPMKNWWVYSYY